MALIDLLLRSTLGNYKAPDVLSVGLFLGGKEVDDLNYRRAEVRKGSWTISDGAAEISVRFGPMQGSIEYDRLVLFNGSEVVQQELNPDGVARYQRFAVIAGTYRFEDLPAPDA